MSALNVALIGAGGVNGLIGEGLARKGAGRAHVADSDNVEPTNLNRQKFVKGSLYKMQGVLGLQPPPEPPFRRYVYDREPREPNANPYRVEYPGRDRRYEHEQSVYRNEIKLVDRVVDMLENGSEPSQVEEPVRRICEALRDADGLGHLAQLVDELGDEVGLAKSWLRSERLKSLGTRTVYATSDSVKLEAVES